jgi:hypothetical protein
MEKEVSGISARDQINSLIEAVTALEVEVIGLRRFEAEANDLRTELERVNKMNRERDQIIRETRIELNQRSLERDRARERMVFVQQQVILLTIWRNQVEEKEREIAQINKSHSQEMDEIATILKDLPAKMGTNQEDFVSWLLKQHQDTASALQKENSTSKNSSTQDEVMHRVETDIVGKNGEGEQDAVTQAATHSLGRFEGDNQDFAERMPGSWVFNW